MESKSKSKSKGPYSPSGKKKQTPVQRSVFLKHDIPALCRAVRTPPTLALQETKDGFSEVALKSQAQDALKNLLRDLLAPRPGRRGFMYRGKIALAGQIIANSGLGKYLQFWSASSTLLWSSVSSAAEFTTLDVLFDEFFIHSVRIHYIPHNRGSSNTSASSSSSGSPGDLNTCAAICSCLYHNAAPYGDTSGAFANMSVARTHKLVDLGTRFNFHCPNIERFDPSGPIGDQSTATSTMGWCQISAVAKYGGTIQISTPVATANAAATNTILAGGVFGDTLVEFDISWRARA